MEEIKKSRRGLPMYRTNPSIKIAMQGQKTGVKRISNPKGDEMIVSNSATGEIITGVNVGFHQNVKVDKTQFVKLYIQGVSAFVGLSKAGGRVLEMVLAESGNQVGKDTIFLSPRIALEVFLIPMATFMRGMKELLVKEILFEHIDENWYYININYIFNGDRLAFLKTYELDTGEVAEDTENPNQGLLPFEGEISTEYFEEDTALPVPFSDAEEFKALASDFCPGRRWDNERKMWIVQAGTPKEPFAKWL